MRIRAQDLFALGIIDEIIPEPPGGAHIDPEQTYVNVDAHLSRTLEIHGKKSVAELVEDRYQKFRKMGIYVEK